MVGKVWKLLLGLSLLGVLAPAASAASTREVNRTVNLNAAGRISIDTYKGSVDVTVWDSPQVEIKAKIEADGSCTDDEERVRDTEVRIDSSPDSLRIKSDYDRLRKGFGLMDVFHWNCGNFPSVHYRLKIPRTAQLNIKDYKSEIRVAGLRSDLRVNSYKGTMTLTDLNGSLDLETYKGEARVEFVNLGGKSRLETYKGNIEVTMPRDSRFDLETDLGRRGNLDSDFSFNVRAGGLRDRGQKYRGSVNGGGPLLYVKTYRGVFRLRQR
ncbi:MAG TPA: hypothetical protein VGL91_11830 [Acidobacteriota bacterium]|jgi:hypothetical protein